ncbi:unnamed protein product [Amaranthus hypochondriacus]
MTTNTLSKINQAFDLDEALTMPPLPPLMNISSPNHATVTPDSSPITQLTNFPTVATGVDVVCPVCVEGFGRSAKQMPCGHVFHATCISPWLSISNSCPLCRHDVIAKR